MGTGVDINFYPQICLCVDIGCNRRYDCGLIFIISDSLAPLVANVHTGCMGDGPAAAGTTEGEARPQGSGDNRRPCEGLRVGGSKTTETDTKAKKRKGTELRSMSLEHLCKNLDPWAVRRYAQPGTTGPSGHGVVNSPHTHPPGFPSH